MTPSATFRRFAAMAALIACAPAALAERPTFEITPFGGYRFGGSFDTIETSTAPSRSVDLDDSGSWGVGLGLYRDPQSFYELLYATQSTQFDSTDASLGAVDVQVDYYQFGGTLLFADQDFMVPYFSFLAGATRFSADQGYGSDSKFSISAAGGVRLPFTDNFAASLGVRGYLTFVNSDTNFFCTSGNDDSGCLVRTSGSTFFQAEAQLGLTLRF
jgi:hypothetical protein